MKDSKLKEKRHSLSPRLNRTFFKHFHMTKEEKKKYKTQETISLGEAILAQYGIIFLEPLAFELEQLIDSALFIPQNNERHVTGNWVRQLFGGKVGGYLLPNALLGVCYEEGIRTERSFIQSFDYLGICKKLIDYWETHQKERSKETTNFEKIEKNQFEHWMTLLKIPIPDQKILNEELEEFQFFFCEDQNLQTLENKKHTEGIVKLYGSMMVKNNESISIKKLLEDHHLISILNNIENITGEKQPTYIIRKYLKAIHSKNLL